MSKQKSTLCATLSEPVKNAAYMIAETLRTPVLYVHDWMRSSPDEHNFESSFVAYVVKYLKLLNWVLLSLIWKSRKSLLFWIYNNIYKNICIEQSLIEQIILIS